MLNLITIDGNGSRPFFDYGGIHSYQVRQNETMP
jgi:hypothetical protein